MSDTTNPTPAVVGTAYTEARVASLRHLFDLVADRENWKRSIDAFVLAGDVADGADLEELREAVIFFTGSVPTIEPASERRIVTHNAGLVPFAVDVLGFRVRAAGYYKAIGA